MIKYYFFLQDCRGFNIDSPSNDKVTQGIVKASSYTERSFLSNDEHAYESPSNVVGVVTTENSSPYMALQDRKEPDHCYQSLQHLNMSAGKGHGDHTV